MIRAPIAALCAVLALGSGCSPSSHASAPRPAEWARPVPGVAVDNLHQVTPDLYRSGQPKERDIPVLRDLGIRSILNLREWHSDEDVVGGAGFTLYRVAMNAGEMSETQLVEVLTILRDCPKPVLVHCWHGSDRTGCVVALYRMVFQGWPRERAVDEFRNGGFGYHQSVYPQIEEYLSTVDVAALKQKLKPAEGRERGTP